MIDYMDSAEKLKCITKRHKMNERPSKKWLAIVAILTLTGAYLFLDDIKGDFYDKHSTYVSNRIKAEIKNA